MSKKKNEEEVNHGFDVKKYDQHMSEQPVCDMLETNYMPYAMSVIVSRALPDVRDGLKPSQRKVLYTMKNMGLKPGNKSKSANIAGTTLRLNPHSDTSCYETMVRMVDKNETLLTPFVEGKGSFGKHYSRDMVYAASRYCITGDALISTDKGIKRIEELLNFAKGEDIDVKVKSFDGKINPANKIFDSGYQDIYEFTLENGLKIKCTPNHPLFVVEDNELVWKLAQDIKEEDKCVILVDTDNELFGTNNDLSEAQTLGRYFAENYDNFDELFEELSKKFDFTELITKSKVPDCVLCGTKEYQVEFLRYFFDDRAAVINDVKLKEIVISGNENFLGMLSILLLQNFGIVSCIKEYLGGFLLKISGKNIKVFREKIGFMSETKSNLVKSIINFGEVSGTSNFDSRFELPDEFKKYEFIKVVNKEQLEREKVYSVRVDSECHSFVANGFINHNTESSLSKIGMKLFEGIDQNAIDMVDNYDGTMKEPSVLPVAFPNILANPTLGIAVGFASNICAFNLKELCDATALRIKDQKNDLLSVMPAPDFSTGGYILYNKEEILNVYKTGRGSIKLRSKYNINTKKNRIEVYQIPYSTTAEAIIERIIELCKKGTISEINDVRDDTDKNGLVITIEYKRSINPETLMDKLFKLTPLEDTFSCNFNVIVDGNPKCLGVYDILDEWIKFRSECVIRMLTFEKENLEKKLHLLSGLEKILADLDKVIKIIRNTEKEVDVVPNLMKAFDIDEIQASYIADIKLRNINKEYILERTKEIDSISKRIKTLAKQIGSKAEINKIIIADLNDIASKYSPERKSEILYEYKEADFTPEEEIIEDELTVVVSKEGCIKKLPRIQTENLPEYQNDDDTLLIQNTNNLEDILVFTNKGNVYKYKLSQVKKDTANSVGTYVTSFCDFESDEEFTYIAFTADYNKNLLLVFEDGHAVVIPLKVYETKTNRKVLINAFNTASKVLLFDIVAEDPAQDLKKYLIHTTDNKAKVFTPAEVSFKTTRTSFGAMIINVKKGQKISKIEECTNLSEEAIKKIMSNKITTSDASVTEDLTVYWKDSIVKKVPRLTPAKKKELEKDCIAYDSNNSEDMLFFTNLGNVYKKKISEIDKNEEVNISEFCEFVKDEKLIFFAITSTYKEHLLIVFEDGHAVIFPIAAYETKTNRKVLINAFFIEKAPVMFDLLPEKYLEIDNKYFVKTSDNKVLIFKPENVSFKTTKTSVGAFIINIKEEGVKVSSCGKINEIDEETLQKFISDKYPVVGKPFE